MSARLIKAGEPFNFSAFCPQGLEGREASALPAAAAFSPSHASTSTFSKIASEIGRVEQATAAECIATDARSDAEEILRAARAEAERLVAQAHARIAETEHSARERAKAEAEVEARAKLDQAVEDLRANLTASLDQVARLRAEMAAHVEQDLVKLALEIAKKVVHREVKVDHEVALTLARVALGRLHSRTSATVRLHPDDYVYVWAHRERLSAESAVEIVEDRSVGAGGCIVNSNLGEIDARIEQQFAEIESDFLSV